MLGLIQMINRFSYRYHFRQAYLETIPGKGYDKLMFWIEKYTSYPADFLFGLLILIYNFQHIHISSNIGLPKIHNSSIKIYEMAPFSGLQI